MTNRKLHNQLVGGEAKRLVLNSCVSVQHDLENLESLESPFHFPFSKEKGKALCVWQNNPCPRTGWKQLAESQAGPSEKNLRTQVPGWIWSNLSFRHRRILLPQLHCKDQSQHSKDCYYLFCLALAHLEQCPVLGLKPITWGRCWGV